MVSPVAATRGVLDDGFEAPMSLFLSYTGSDAHRCSREKIWPIKALVLFSFIFLLSLPIGFHRHQSLLWRKEASLVV